MSVFSYLRMTLRPPGKKPPPKNHVDVYFDAEQGLIVTEDDQGAKTPLGTGSPLVLDAAPEDGSAEVPNFVETDFPGANNDLRFDGDATTITFLRNASFVPSHVLVTGSEIEIGLNSPDNATITLTASQVKTLVEASSEAMALITVALKAGSDGTGQIDPDGSTFGFGGTVGPLTLAGGTAAVEGTPADYIGQIAIVNEDTFYKNVRLDPVKWIGPLN